MRVLLVQILILIPFLAEANSELIFRSEVSSEKANLQLEDVADLSGFSDEEQKTLGKLSLISDLKWNQSQTLSSAEISQRIRGDLAKIENEWGRKIQLKLPAELKIERKMRSLDVKNATADLQNIFSGMCEACEIEISNVTVPRLPSKNQSAWTISAPRELPRGSFSVPVEVMKEQGEKQIFWIQGRLSVFRQVPVALRAINLGERLQKSDIGLQRKDLTFAQDSTPNIEEIQGRRLKQSLRAGSVVFSNYIEQEKALRRGEVVKVRSGEGGWEVALSAVAEQDGVIGDSVRVRNPKSNLTLVGVVTGPGEVELR